MIFFADYRPILPRSVRWITSEDGGASYLAAAMALTGGLIGPPGMLRNYTGSLAGTPVFLGTSDPDPHVPFARVRETETVLSSMGAKVELRRYPGMPHTMNDEELEVCRNLLKSAIA